MKREAKSAIIFRHWLRAHPRSSASFEIKDTRGRDALRFSEVTDEQLNFGLAIQNNKGVLIRTEGVTGLPDYVYLNKEPSYIVIRYPKFFAMIDVWKFMIEKEINGNKSLTSTRAKEIADEVIKL